MSWVGGNFTFDFSKSRESINREVAKSLAEDGASSQYKFNGTFRAIRFNQNTVFSSYEAAEKAVGEMRKNHDDNIAVPYYDFENALAENKKLISYEAKCKELEAKYRAEEAKNYLSTLTSEFVSCRTCKSKLNRSYLVDRMSNRCPICNHDLRPESAQKHINEIFQRWRVAEREKESLEKELTKKLMENPEKWAKKKWYVAAALYIG